MKALKTGPRPRSRCAWVLTLSIPTLVLLPGAAWAGWEEAVAAFEAGQYQAAVDELQLFVEQSPNDWKGHWLLGSSLLKLGRTDEGLGSLRTAYALERDQPEVWSSLAKGYMANGQAAEAAALLQGVDAASLSSEARITYDQFLGEALAASAQDAEEAYNAAAQAFQAGDRVRAKPELEEALAIDPGNASAWAMLGALSLEEGEFAMAVEHADKALEIEPTNSLALEVEQKANAAAEQAEAATRDAAVATRPRGPSWETFGDWRVAAVHDDLDPDSHVIIRTKFVPDEGESYHREYDFGFRVFGGSLITLDVSMNLPGKNYWPYCDYDAASYSVDGGKAVYLATIDRGGSCDDVSLAVVRRFQAGNSARLKLGYTTGRISLKGFTAAWDRLQQLSYK